MAKKVVGKSDIVFVDRPKYDRAVSIVAAVNNANPRTAEAIEYKSKFSALMAEADVDPKSPEAVEFVYDKLGGLIRTHEEHEVAEETKEKIKTKGKSKKGEKADENDEDEEDEDK
jgi:hypothetical protein